MKRTSMLLMLLLALTMKSYHVFAQSVTITLMPGWNWISCPMMDTLDFETALGSFTPAVGDMIKSQWSNASYRADGHWRGQISQFYPGYGYKYYSNRNESVTVTFNLQQPTPQVGVSTLDPIDITAVSAIVGGIVTIEEGNHIFARGVCWDTEPNPDIDGNHISNGAETGSFSNTLTELTPSTTYYVRAYVVTDYGLIYGNEIIFSTLNGIPVVTTSVVTNILGDGATCGGTVTDGGGLDIIERGVCWSTSHNPTLSDSHTTDGTGLGEFVSTLSDLMISTTYYVRAYATSAQATSYGEEMSFTTQNGIPMVMTAEVTDILGDGATCGGTVTADGGLAITDRGVCWSTSPNPNLNGSHSTDGIGTGSFVSTLTGLTPNTTYYVRAYATNSYVTVYGNQRSFTTELPSYTVTVSSNPTNGGTATGGSTYVQGQSCSVQAVANTGYTFSNWTENDNVVSTDANYTFIVNADRILVANFTLQSFTVDVLASPSNGGNVSGSDNYNYGQSCTVSATANTGYTFSNWTENDSIVSTDTNYTFTVNANRTLVANFTLSSYTISVSASPSIGGSVSGGDTYNFGQSCTVSATANTGYTFSNWTENDNVVSTDANYTFTVNADRILVANFTLQSFTVDVSANPSNGGSVSGGDTYNYGQSCTVSAIANTGYTFSNWTENDSVVSTDANYTFVVNADRILVANFTLPSYTISVSANPSIGGSVSGGGTYTEGQSCTVSAIANTNYVFTSWIENGSVVSTDATYTFTVTSNRILVANFNVIYNGREYVDLGLPSGALWATCNVGATTPEGYGNLYSWYYNFGNMPANMPTIEQWRELANNTTGTWTNRDGVNGWLYTASNGNTLFLPAAGYQIGNAIFSRGSEGIYWSKTLTLNSNVYFVWIFKSSISSNGYSGEWDYGAGCSVRQVLTP